MKKRTSSQDPDVDLHEKSNEVYNAGVDTSGVDKPKLLRKIDLAIIPWLSFLYLLSFLDRTSIGNAKLYGLEHDLHMTDQQYLLSLTIFFVSYAIFEVPSNIFLKRLRPSIWLSFLMFFWGIMMTLQGLVHDFPQLMGMRWLLGMFEAGLFPGVNYYLSCWYQRSELGLRAAIFFSAATVSGAFSGLLAAGISHMDGIGGKPGWAWIFILEGLLTVVAAAMSPWIIQDFPDTAKFLTEAERTVLIRRLQGGGQFSAAGEHFKANNIFSSLKDWKTWNEMFVYMGCVMPLYPCHLKYHCSWVSNNVEGSYKRSVTLGMVIGFGNINGVVSSNVYRAREKPWYPLGHGLVLMYIALGLIASMAYLLLLKRENARRDRGERTEYIEDLPETHQKQNLRNGRFATVADAKMEKGDAWSGYRYTT